MFVLQGWFVLLSRLSYFLETMKVYMFFSSNKEEVFPPPNFYTCSVTKAEDSLCDHYKISASRPASLKLMLSDNHPR